MNVRELGLFLACEKCADALAQRVARCRRPARSSSARGAGRAASQTIPAPATTSARPSPVSSVSSRITPRSRSTVSPSISFGSGVPAAKVDLPRGRRVRAHHAEQERAIGGAQRRHRKAVAHRLVGKVPVAPRDEAREIGFQIGAAQHAVRRSAPRRISSTRPFHISGFSARSFAKCASISARRSSANGHGAGSKRRSSRDSGMIGMSSCARVVAGAPARGQASIVPSVTTTAPPPIEAPVSLPPPIFSVSSIRLGRPIS